MYSSVTAPRSAKGVCDSASSSGFSQPAPMPTVRHHQYGQDQADLAGFGGDPGGGCQLLHPVARIGRVERAAFRIRVAGGGSIGQRDMIGRGQIGKAQGFPELRHFRHDLRRGHRSADRQVEPDLHVCSSISCFVDGRDLDRMARRVTARSRVEGNRLPCPLSTAPPLSPNLCPAVPGQPGTGSASMN